MAMGGECHRQIGSYRTLADATFAAGNCQNASRRGHCGVGGFLARIPARFCHHLRALIGVHLTPFDFHFRDTRVGFKSRFNVIFDLSTKRAAFDRELDPDGHQACGAYPDIGGHAKIHDVGPKFGVDYGPQQVAHFIDRRRGNRALSHALNLPMCRVSPTSTVRACHHTPRGR